MSVKIRLQRHGRKQAPIYHIVVADARSPRDGSFIERIGTYNPMTKPASIDIDRMKAFEWLKNGAQPTETVHAILRFKGIMYYRHLQRGVSKGAMTAEEAEIRFRSWVDEKEARIEARVKASAEERKERAGQISGTKKAPKKKDVVQDDELLNVNLAEAAAAETAADDSAEIANEEVKNEAVANEETAGDSVATEEVANNDAAGEEGANSDVTSEAEGTTENPTES